MFTLKSQVGLSQVGLDVGLQLESELQHDVELCVNSCVILQNAQVLYRQAHILSRLFKQQ